MPFVGAEEITCAMPICEDHDRCIGQTDREVGVLLHDPSALRDIGCGEGFQLIHAALDFVDEGDLRCLTDAPADQVIEFRQNKRRDESRRS